MGQLQIKNLRKIYDNKVEVLKDIDIEANHGEFVVLVGPSGCGKSTLLRCIAGLEEVTSGDILISGKRVNDLSPSERDIAMVFQDYALYPHMSVKENLSFGLKIRKTPLAEIEKRVQTASQSLDINHLLDRKPSQLSGGQRQRVAIGRAIVRNPSLFLFDEPLSNLDAQLRAQTRIELASLHRQLGNTVVYVTHDQVEAMTLASRIVVLNKGVVQQIGAPLEIYHAPKNKFVAQFIGSPSMNFFDGDLVVRDGKSLFMFENAQIDLTGAPNLPAQPGPYSLGVRPESLKVLARDGREADGVVDFKPMVVLLEPHGHEAHLVAKIGSHQIVIRSANPKRLEIMGAAKPGETLPTTIERKEIHWFERGPFGRRVV